MAETPQSARTKSGQFIKKGEESLAKAKTLSKESVLETGAKDRAAVDTQFAKIAELKQERIAELEIVTEAVDFQKGEIERLRGVEVAALAIEEANLKLEATKAENARKLGEHQKDFASKLEEARIENTQKVQQFSTERLQVQTAWNYTFEQTKKAANDRLNEEIRVAQQAEKVRHEDLTRSWDLREQELKSQEKEVFDLRAQVESFPGLLKTEAEAAKAQAFSISKKDKDHEIAILNSQNTAQRTVDQSTIANLNGKLADKDKVIEQLTIQLAAANLAQKEIATKALDTAGNVKALADLQAATQANNSNGQKRA